jgi:uncharacterized protein (TIGR03643 family)
MSRRGDRPYTRTRNPEPPPGSEDWVIWAAWADRVSFEDIEARSGYREEDVIRLMRRSLKPASFRRWRARVSGRDTKHRQRFMQERGGARAWRELLP